jgi:hypothetical protein
MQIQNQDDPKQARKEATPRKRTTKKVSAGKPKFLGRTPANAKIQQYFPSRDPKFMGRTKNVYRKAAAK